MNISAFSLHNVLRREDPQLQRLLLFALSLRANKRATESEAKLQSSTEQLHSIHPFSGHLTWRALHPSHFPTLQLLSLSQQMRCSLQTTAAALFLPYTRTRAPSQRAEPRQGCNLSSDTAGAALREDVGSWSIPAGRCGGYLLLCAGLRAGPPASPAYVQLPARGDISRTAAALAPARLLITREADTVPQQTAAAYCGEKQNEGRGKKKWAQRKRKINRNGKHAVLCCANLAITTPEPKYRQNRLAHGGGRQAALHGCVREAICGAAPEPASPARPPPAACGAKREDSVSSVRVGSVSLRSPQLPCVISAAFIKPAA